jgi:hypothetical protein
LQAGTGSKKEENNQAVNSDGSVHYHRSVNVCNGLDLTIMYYYNIYAPACQAKKPYYSIGYCN